MTDPTPAAPTRPRRLRTIVVTVGVTLIVVLVAGDSLKSAASGLWHAVFGDDQAAEGDGHTYYTCGMHPWVVLPHPGLCPICQMDLEPIDPSKFEAEITIDPVVTQNMGVRVADVERAPLTRTLRSVGTVDYDETRVRDVNLKVAGWLEKVDVDYLGAPVKAGDPLFDIYSPELFSAQEEYLAALRRGTSDFAAAARTRLEFFDVSKSEIDALAKRGEPQKAMTIASPWDGVVVEKHANAGARVEPGTMLYRIADMSKVWVMVSLYEYQLPYVSEGQAAVMSLPYFPGQEFEGRVIYIYPTLDVRTREVKARVEFDNTAGLLKPGMFANIEIRATLARDRVMVPREAVIDTGTRQVAFVSLGEGRFEPRDVRLGVEGESGRVEVLDGLKAGEKVVVSGQFLLDSEARIREGLAKMIRGDLASEQVATAASAGATELSALPDAAAKALGELLEAYFVIQNRLAGDATEGVAEAAATIASAVDALLATPIPDHPHFWHQHEEVATVRGEALELVKGPAIADARLAFADLSIALSKLVRATGVPPALSVEVQELHCPMYREDQGGTSWLQPAGAVRNPYYGSQMLECFDERAAIPRTGAPSDPTGDAAGGTP
ncbi:MAG: efflux RND transporter periplasmic adaptor subunit [Deltaproteobacteria bacterium HGW-Deltaproteobacteria-14]|jgi:multidrug efflux pump subunit AcrA (membrane-fusion protein)|nr:MAG: efflux RND transporter periplasmic adaptor subunit [Deltaproteobacteria bacterium HGW-Deltaproteobacteria-14]